MPLLKTGHTYQCHGTTSFGWHWHLQLALINSRTLFLFLNISLYLWSLLLNRIITKCTKQATKLPYGRENCICSNVNFPRVPCMHELHLRCQYLMNKFSIAEMKFDTCIDNLLHIIKQTIILVAILQGRTQQ